MDIASNCDQGGHYSQERFRKRMEAQCCQIEQYRVDIKRSEGRSLSLNEAALEWIERYANAFDKGDRF